MAQTARQNTNKPTETTRKRDRNPRAHEAGARTAAATTKAERAAKGESGSGRQAKRMHAEAVLGVSQTNKLNKRQKREQTKTKTATATTNQQEKRTKIHKCIHIYVNN